MVMVLFTIKQVVRHKGTICIGTVECDEIRRGDKVCFNGHESIVFAIEDFCDLIESAKKGQEVSILIPGWSDVEIQEGDQITSE